LRLQTTKIKERKEGKMTNSKKVAVLGGGHGAHTMAADLTMKGFDVHICEFPEFKDTFNVTLDRQAIEFIDAFGNKSTVKLAKATLDLAEAIRGAKYVMISAPAMGAVRFFEAAIPYLEDGQTVIKWSGNFSALIFARMLKEKGIKTKITLAESQTLPWGCRLVAPGTVQVMVWVTSLMLAAFPGKETGRIIKEISKIYPVVPGENVLASSLNNLNPIVHPVGTMMNVGWIETAGNNFYLYRDGITFSVAKCIKATFEEVSRLAKTLSLSMIEYPEEDFWKKSAIMSTHSRAAFDKEGMVFKITGPSSLKSRYITEDLPYGLVPMVHLARKYNVSTPVIDAIITLASVSNQTDYMKEGLNLKDLGLSKFSKKEMIQYLYEGDL
jgi:opine dehydrogenase